MGKAFDASRSDAVAAEGSPQADSVEPLVHLRAELGWLWLLLEARLRALQRARILPAPDEPYPGMTIDPSEVEARLEMGGPAAFNASPSQASVLASGASHAERAAIEAARNAARGIEDGAGPGAFLPLVQLRRCFQLDDLEYLVLLTGLAAEFEPSFSRLFGYLQNHFQRQYPTLGLVADCLVEPQARARASALFAPGRALLGHGLLVVEPQQASVPLIQRAFRAHERVVRLVEGDRSLAPELVTSCALWVGPEADTRPLVLSAGDQALWRRLEHVLTHVEDGEEGAEYDRFPVLVLRGPEGVGKRRWVREVAKRFGLSVLTVELQALPRSNQEMAERLRSVLREARLQNSVIAFRGWEHILQPELVALTTETSMRAGEPPARALSRVFAQAMAGHALPVAFLLEESGAHLPELDQVRVFELGLPDLETATKLWARFLPARMRGEGSTPQALAEAFRLTPGKIESAVALASTDAIDRGEAPVLTPSDLGAAITRQVQHRLGETTQLVTTHLTWGDLVVPEEVALQLQEIVERYRFKAQVLQGWSLGRRFGENLGLSVLFDGPPGTGKTMSAGIIAAELGLDMYQVDLSRVVSKYIGETEKQLSRVFDEAERSRALLLFDEADSLFAKRTEVKSSNDRYANLEVNFLLQRVERFSGVAILTTNLPDSLDTAFTRRLSLRVSFPKPDFNERLRLWQSMLSQPDLPVGDVDFELLAEEYDLSGGLIRNAVLRAAFMAAARRSRVDQLLLETAARVEMTKQGMLVRDDEL